MPAVKIPKIQINLLPEEYGDRSKTGAFALTVAKANKLLAIIAAATFTLIAGIFVYENIVLRREVDQNKILKQEIVARQDSEQKLILLKDRLQKAKRVLDQEATVDIKRTSQLINNLPSDVSVGGILFSDGALKLNLVASNSTILTKTLSSTLSKEIFQTVTLTSFGFQPNQGYKVALELK